MQHSHTHREIIKGKTIYVFINGDIFFEAKAVVVHPKSTRNFEALLIRLTEILNPRFGAVLHLKTPDGLVEVKSLEELQNGANYVAYGKKFQALDYSDISARLQTIAQGGHALASPREGTMVGEFKRIIVSGRARKIVRQPILINVFVNGEPFTPAKRVLLQPWVHKTWDNVLEQIASKVKIKTAIRKIVELSTKSKVSFGADLEDQQYYVACGSEKFKDYEYGLSATMFTPKQQMAKRYPTLPPVEPKNKQEVPPKPTLSAPTEKSKEEFTPQPPPGKKPDHNTSERTRRKPIKLRSPSPEEHVTREESPPAQHNGHLDNSATNRRVSPILEQKTPSTAGHGEDELKSEYERAGEDSRHVSPSRDHPMDTPSPHGFNENNSTRSLVDSRQSQLSPQSHKDDELKKTSERDLNERPLSHHIETTEEAAKVADETNADGNSKHNRASSENETMSATAAPAEAKKADDGNIVVEDKTVAESLTREENTDNAENSVVDSNAKTEKSSADYTDREEHNTNVRESKGNQGDAEKNTSTKDEHVPDSVKAADKQVVDSANAADEQVGDNANAADEQVGDSANAADEQVGDSANAADQQVADGSNTANEHVADDLNTAKVNVNAGDIAADNSHTDEGSVEDNTHASAQELEVAEQTAAAETAGSTTPARERDNSEQEKGDAEKELSGNEQAPKADEEQLRAETPDKTDDNNNGGDAVTLTDPVEALVG